MSDCRTTVLAGESMAQRVERRALFASLGSRAGGVLGVRPIYFSASIDIAVGILVCYIVRHWYFLSALDLTWVVVNATRLLGEVVERKRAKSMLSCVNDHG